MLPIILGMLQNALIKIVIVIIIIIQKAFTSSYYLSKFLLSGCCVLYLTFAFAYTHVKWRRSTTSITNLFLDASELSECIIQYLLVWVWLRFDRCEMWSTRSLATAIRARPLQWHLQHMLGMSGGLSKAFTPMYLSDIS